MGFGERVMTDMSLSLNPQLREANLKHIYVVGYRLNCLDEPVFMAVSKPLLTEFGIHHRLESCVLPKGRVLCLSVLIRAIPFQC